eukprot:CAMPEP_0182945802 /NCGR_PEP_ID=MMETSP0105_2-20130417/56051_1 /TAXON_ID=81532 ORGANISM="Acanthoeca-like sp., Strain 10tr" /NCGR_SAMPLE_ID=MMETSP0105_2 /ASSEMBLY_ACC=CAM_ASM_000205 /LENGTH=56 /DNA_ID=CAMNT_0025085855 /DNA_START=330 /DNA_END=496 /DNA_ORIENTATION=+
MKVPVTVDPEHWILTPTCWEAVGIYQRVGAVPARGADQNAASSLVKEPRCTIGLNP